MGNVLLPQGLSSRSFQMKEVYKTECVLEGQDAVRALSLGVCQRLSVEPPEDSMKPNQEQIGLREYRCWQKLSRK